MSSMLSRWVLPVFRLPCPHRQNWPLSCGVSSFLHPSSPNTDTSTTRRSASAEAVMFLTNLDKEKALEAIERFKLLKFADEDKMKEAAVKLDEIGIPVEEISKYPDVLAISSITIDNYNRLLYEFGFTKVIARDLAHYKRLMNRRISLLKAHGCILEKTNVAAHLLSKIPGMPKSVAEEILKKVGTVDEMSNLRSLQWTLVHLFLCWRLSADPAKVDQIMKTYSVRLRNKSFGLMSEAIDMLVNELNFTTQKLLQHGYLIHCYPPQLRASLQAVPKLGGLPLLDVAHKHPRVLLTNTSTLINTQRLLTHFGITNDAVRRCFDVFTLSTRTVQERLVSALNDPQLGGLLGHPRILLLVMHSRKAQQRLQHLRQLQMNCFTLNLISASTNTIFSRYANEREDRNKGHDIIYYLSRSLGCDPSSLRLSLNRHPYWHHVSLPSVRTTLMTLAERGFPPEQIRRSVHVLLYPTLDVIEALNSMNYTTPASAQDWSKILKFDHIEFDEDSEIPEISDPLIKEITTQEYSEGSSCKEVLLEVPVEDSPVTEWNLVLPMCNYLLEKPHHFTGDGIWNQQALKDDKDVVASVAVM